MPTTRGIPRCRMNLRCAAAPPKIAAANASNVMAATLFDKIWQAHRVGQRPDGRDLIYIDRHVLHELHAHHAFARIEREQRPVRRSDLTFAVQDHTVATKPG